MQSFKTAVYFSVIKKYRIKIWNKKVKIMNCHALIHKKYQYICPFWCDVDQKRDLAGQIRPKWSFLTGF